MLHSDSEVVVFSAGTVACVELIIDERHASGSQQTRQAKKCCVLPHGTREIPLSVLAVERWKKHILISSENCPHHYKGQATIRVLLEGGIALRVYAAGW